jgi:hypothetical protein
MWIFMPLVSCIVVSICIHHTCIHHTCIEEEEDTLFAKYGPTRGMNTLLISTCSVLHVRQNSSIYTVILHTVITKFVIWLRKWCTASNEGIHHTCIEEEEDTLFAKYGPTRGMNIHIYNYLKHNICLTKTKIQLHIHVI